jgi:hypothetical protein
VFRLLAYCKQSSILPSNETLEWLPLASAASLLLRSLVRASAQRGRIVFRNITYRTPLFPSIGPSSSSGMSQQSVVEEQLRALLERHERERRELLEKLSKAPPHASQTPPSLDGTHNSSRTPAPSRPLVDTDVHASTTVPHSVRNDLRPPPKQLQQVLEACGTQCPPHFR